MATKEREEIKGDDQVEDGKMTVKKEGTTWFRKATDRGQWKALMEGNILQWMLKA